MQCCLVIHVSNVRLSDPDTAWAHITQYPRFTLVVWDHTSFGVQHAKICHSMSDQINMPSILGYLCSQTIQVHFSNYPAQGKTVWATWTLYISLSLDASFFAQPQQLSPDCGQRSQKSRNHRNQVVVGGCWWFSPSDPMISDDPDPPDLVVQGVPFMAAEMPSNSPWLWNGKIIEV